MVKLMLSAGDVTYGFWKNFMRPRHNLRGRYEDSNRSIVPWAVSNGGANVFGRLCCEELAGAGLNLIVVDIDSIGPALLKTAREVKLETICYDFANLGTEEHYTHVAILINNSQKRSSLTHEATFNVLRTFQWPDTMFQVFSKALIKVFDRPS